VIGIKSLAISLLLIAALAIGAAHGMRGFAELGNLSVASCLVLGALAAIGVGLVGAGGSLHRAGGAALDLRRRELVVESSDATVGERPQATRARELPGWMLRTCLGVSFLVIGGTALGNHGVVSLRELAAGGPPSGRCKDAGSSEAAEAEPEAEPPPPPVDQAGCALVRRAYQLGYSKSLGSCAPRQAVVVAKPKVAAPPERCTRRQIDEPFLHYAWRRWTQSAGWIAEVRPVHGTAKRVEEVRTRLGAFSSLTASSGHALGATPHASHHLWISLPDPDPVGWLGRLLPHQDCEARYVELPLWPRWKRGQEALLVQHALGQLLFASRFGTTTSCDNFRLHWGASADACDRLVANPQAFLRQQGAWDEVAGVLDRRRRQLEVRALAADLGQPAPPQPPPASAVVSLQCVNIDGRAAKAEVRGRAVMIGGESLGVRQLRTPRVGIEQDGPIEVLAELAQLLAGVQPGGAGAKDVLDDVIEQAAQAAAAAGVTPPPAAAPVASQPQLLEGAGFALARLEAIEGSDPFAGVRWPLRRADLIEVYPFQRALFNYIDGFRRRYHAQRGRL
jgi:hypothetical protein